MWDFLHARDLIGLQRQAVLKELDRQIRELHDEGYHVERDRLLDKRIQVKKQLQGYPEGRWG
jgi:hypothetical protein